MAPATTEPLRRKRPAVSYARRVDSLTARRDHRMAEVAVLRGDGHQADSFVDKAHTLLTRGWSSANWKAREGILAAVDWLLRMELLRRRKHDPGKLGPIFLSERAHSRSGE